MGHLCGTLSDGEIPLLVGLEHLSQRITRDHLKAFCAAFGTTGTSPLIHIAGITPEAPTHTNMKHLPTRKITADQLERTYQSLNQQQQHNNSNNNQEDVTIHCCCCYVVVVAD